MCASVLLSRRNTPPAYGVMSPSGVNLPFQTSIAKYNKSVGGLRAQESLPTLSHMEQNGSRSSIPNTQAILATSRSVGLLSTTSPRATVAAATPFPTAIELRPNITVISVISNQGPVSSMLFFKDLFALIARYALPIVLTATSIVSITLALPASDSLAAAIEDLESLYPRCVRVGSGNAILSIVGDESRDDAGLIGRCCNAIGAEDIDIKMISQGAAKGSISIVTAEEDGEKAMRALRQELFDRQKSF